MQVRKIVKMITAITLSLSLISPNVIASAGTISSLPNASVSPAIASNLFTSIVKESINDVLSCKYETMLNGKVKTPNSKISDATLSKLLKTENEFNCTWYKKVGLKISNYSSNVEIKNIKKIDDTKYLLNVQQTVELILNDTSKTISKGIDDYIFEITYLDEAVSIDKMINLAEDVQATNNTTATKSLKESATNTNLTEDIFKENDTLIKNKQSSIEEKKMKIDYYIMVPIGWTLEKKVFGL